MVWRVDFRSGYAIFADEESAREVYDDPQWEAIRLRECENIFDEGWVVDGMPDFIDLTRRYEDVYGKN